MGHPSPKYSAESRQQAVRLRREVERPRRENEMLLKASAFFASRQL